MKLHVKLILSLLLGLLTVFIVFQIVQVFLSGEWMKKLSNDNLTLLEKREMLHVETINQTATPVLIDFVEQGEMGKLGSLMRLYTQTEGLLEYSLYDGQGIVSYSSSSEVLKSKKTLPVELKSKLLSQPSKVSRVTSSAFEVYQPIVVSAKCIECHENLKPGNIGGVTAIRFSAGAIANSEANWRNSIGHFRKVNLTFAILTPVVIILVFILLTSLLVKRLIAVPLSSVVSHLQGAADQLNGATVRFQSSSQVLAEGATAQAANLEESSAALQQVASTTSGTLQIAQKAKELTNRSRLSGDTAMADMREMNLAMDAIKASSDEIAKILKTIDEMAFQTNILALNAAVEAARAGESGLGFSVVADEVRNLAQRCAAAAHEIESKIENSINKGAHGVQISGKVAKSLTEIVANARRVDEFVEQISHSANEQNQGIEQVSEAVRKMDKVTQSNAGSAEETASAAASLSAQSQAIGKAIGELERLVKGHEAKQNKPVRVPMQPAVGTQWETANRDWPRSRDLPQNVLFDSRPK